MLDTSELYRSAAAIERDFMDVRAARLSTPVSVDKLERLWDEANEAAAGLLPDTSGKPYLALLKQLQDEFDRLKRNAYLARTGGMRWNAHW